MLPTAGPLTRRRFTQLAGLAAGSLAVPGSGLAAPDISLDIAPYTLEAGPRHRYKTVAYNGQVPGALIRMREGEARSVEIRNSTLNPEVVHWHGMLLPSAIDGAMEEGTPMIAPGKSTSFTLTPSPAGFRWYHTHTFAGKDLSKAQYGGLHGFLLIEPRDNPARYDQEVFLALHDWGGRLDSSPDGSVMPAYEAATINGKMLGAGEPIRVRQGQRLLLHVLNSSPTEVHWVAFAGHQMQVVALDGNAVPQRQTVPMLRLAPAERACVLVELTNPGAWIFGEVRRHVQAAGMGIVFEYANAPGSPTWVQPAELVWNYSQFAGSESSNAETSTAKSSTAEAAPANRVELVFDSKFEGHGGEEHWRINGKSYPHTDSPLLTAGERYRLVLHNKSLDDHPLHLHRHIFEVRRVDGSGELQGLRKDVVLVRANTSAEVEFLADNAGPTLFHCHQQDHMDRGFMMVFRYA